ncbi:hypothetical protein BSL78_03283 [Apostichopus japonicus]|uniref:BEN domain-containing protein n=1 Tax=Stichopus japonicus TaxID=307972 RepID=A0A2G8LHT8_STIJA|nr:hypothetical protein BSL78_03283 [Apostichopus japonicus]
MYAVVRWTSSTVTSIGLTAETDVKCGSFEVGATVTATYRNSPYDAKMLFIGDLDSMNERLSAVQSEHFLEGDCNLEKSNSRVYVKSSLTEEDDAVDDNFVEASLIASLKSEVASLLKRIEDLEKQNNLLQNLLPDTLTELKDAIASLNQKRCRIIPPATPPRRPLSTFHVPVTPPPSTASPPKQPLPIKLPVPMTPSSLSAITKLRQPLATLQPVQTPPLQSAPGTVEDIGKTAIFHRRDMASRSLSGRNGKDYLPVEKVQAIIAYCQKQFPGADVSTIRLKMSTKLRDEKKAIKGY